MKDHEGLADVQVSIALHLASLFVNSECLLPAVKIVGQSGIFTTFIQAECTAMSAAAAGGLIGST